MNTEEIHTEKGRVTVLKDPGIVIKDGNSFLETVFSAGAETLAVFKENLTEEFFNLKTGIAGDVLQKVSNYRVKMIILGDFRDINSNSLRDFIFESNKNGQVIFADNLDKAIKLLK